MVKDVLNLFRSINRQNIKKSLFYIRTYGFVSFLEKAREKLR